jgi:hypothetical protein
MWFGIFSLDIKLQLLALTILPIFADILSKEVKELQPVQTNFPPTSLGEPSNVVNEMQLEQSNQQPTFSGAPFNEVKE